jgi:hypothetical protein
MNLYRIYGLKVKSEIILPEIEEANFDEPEVSICFGEIKEPSDYGEENYILESKNGDRKLDKYYMKGVGGFVAEEGREIKIAPEEGAEEKGFRFLVLGLAMGFILDQRGTIALHASAVDLGGKSVAFTGPKGAGKSTAAAAFHAAGYSIITDDLLPVSLENGSAYSVCGLPHLKLNSRSAKLLGRRNLREPHIIDPESSKKLYSPEGSSINRRTPLHTIYILDHQEGIKKCKLEKLSGIKSTKHIINSIYSFQMKDELSEKVSKKSLRLAKKSEVKILKRPSYMSDIEELVKFLLKNEF